MKQVYWTEYELDCIRKYYPKHGAVFVDEIIFRKYGRRRGRRNVMKKAMLMGVRFIGEHRTTNHSVLSVEKDRLELFLNSLIETESVSIVPAQSRMSLQSISPETNQMLVQSMTDMIRDLSAAKTSEEIKNTSRKAQAMTGMVNAFVGVAKLEIETIKITRKK